jgi:hypothetical protein
MASRRALAKLFPPGNRAARFIFQQVSRKAGLTSHLDTVGRLPARPSGLAPGT